jgi:hypothetical protein
MCRLIPGVATVAVLVLATTAMGQAESFTYQGQLKQQGSPLSGLVDMRFLLFDADTAETPIAGPLVFDGQASNLAPVQVSNGLFTVELDFGTQALQQGGQWLGIEVRAPHDPADAATYTPLTPRQRLTAAPFALSVPGLATSTTGVEVSGDVHALGEIAASAYTSNSPLIFKVNPLNTECARFDDANCFLGLGTTAPQARLHVGGVAGVDGIMFPDGSIQTTAAGLGGGDGFWSPSGSNIFSNNGGNVGIGTTAPAAKLDIAASGEGAELLRFSTERPWVFRQVYTGPSASLRLYSTTGQKRFEITANDLTNVATFLADSINSKVGIGTTVPASKLDIAAAGDGAELLRFSTERPWVFRQVRTGPSAGLQLLSTVGIKLFEITAAGGANVATFVADDANPRVGIGTTNPISKLDIVGQDGLGITGYQPFLTLKDSNSNTRARIQTANGDIAFFTEASFTTGKAPLLVRNSGTTSVRVLEILGGADVAEPFDISSSGEIEPRPGMVVAIDPQQAGRLRVASQAYDTRVAGVISGAGGVNTGMLMGQEGSVADGSHAVALAGRVYVWCDTTQSAIEPGDLLTSSDTPGHAMKAVDRERRQGAMIGKAMSALAQGERGLVLVLVNLQ